MILRARPTLAAVDEESGSAPGAERAPERPSPHPEADHWATATDGSLRRAAALGDHEAFREIVDRHGPSMYRYCRRMLPDHGDAQEAVQDAFVAAWKALPDFRGDSALRTWLFVLVRRKAADLLRKRRPVPVPDEAVSHLVDTAGDPATAGLGLVAALDAALKRLPEGQRSVWVLREVEHLSYAEIADVLGSTTNVVRGQLARARAALQQQLEPWR